MGARFCIAKTPCRRRLNFTLRKGRCTNCGGHTTKLKYPPQVEAAERNRLIWTGDRLIIRKP